MRLVLDEDHFISMAVLAASVTADPSLARREVATFACAEWPASAAAE